MFSRGFFDVASVAPLASIAYLSKHLLRLLQGIHQKHDCMRGEKIFGIEIRSKKRSNAGNIARAALESIHAAGEDKNDLPAFLHRELCKK